ncbi:P-loop NTPase [Thioclava electrotropha]|uniref:Novel STAND NTPase 5 domain-containing protein n=1 Tax=Thioclava electrotropha TaxID=1549850 RepID=A0ABX6YY20_9RHOB|nr:SIR2 family protein [Thioclava electrotropha]QPZ92055.1 hypothetical protein AKL02_014955 [Thioclava electrotropha]
MSKESKTLPHTLVEAVKDSRAVLVLGAGASLECKNNKGNRPPDSAKLRNILAKKFLGKDKDDRDLAMVSEISISAGAGEVQVFEELSRSLSGFEPSDAHKQVAEFKWRGIATTNYDTILEQAYSSSAVAKQHLLPFVKDAEPYDDRLRAYQDPLPYLKLHGCLNHRLDKEIPLILSHEHYHRYKANRSTLMARLTQWAQHSVLIFIGYKIADAHIRSLVYDIDPGRRPQWYIVTPGADEHDEQYWLTKNIQIVRMKFGDFMSCLDSEVPALFRGLTPPDNSRAEPITKHFRTEAQGSDALKKSLEIDLDFVHSGMPFDEVDAKSFYSGFENGWAGIFRKFDFARKTGEKILYDALDRNDAPEQRFFLLQGAGGSGKTIALKRAAHDAAVILDEPVLWLKENGALHPEIFEELYDLTGLRWNLFVDHVALHSDALQHLLDRLRSKRIPITIIASEREADWTTYCSRLEKDHPPDIYSLRSLTEREAEDLVDLLERHKCLGMLQSKTREERIAAFMAEDRSDRQLLVALHELTLGKPFEDIILEEYERVQPEAARRLYLDIATMHQFSVTARAGAISRISAIRFDDFEEKFFEPLRGLVRVIEDRYTGDKGYASRHSRIAKIVFGVSCSTDEEKSAQFSRILGGLDAGFSSDKRILEGICKGRSLAQMFRDVEHGRVIFDAATSASPTSAFLYQQGAIFEYSHRKGNLDRAQELAETAQAIDGNNHVYIHTLAEVARRKANEATSKIRADQLRGVARSYLNDIWIKDDARKDLSFCNLLIDETFSQLKQLHPDSKEYEFVEFDTKVDETVSRLRKAQQDHPNESEFPAAESRLWQMLGESELARKSLERAAKAKPRNSGIFIRLSRIVNRKDGVERAVDILQAGLDKFPSDKTIHFEMAKLLLTLDDVDVGRVEFCLRSSFSSEDHNFEARFLMAEFLFWCGEVEQAKQLFEHIDQRAPEGFRRLAPKINDEVTEKLGQYAGTVSGRSERYFFIRFGGYPGRIFANISDLTDCAYEDLRDGSAVRFRLRFNRKGPVAYQIVLSK